MPIPIHFLPHARLLKRLFLGPSALESVAYREDILCPEEKTKIQPAVFLPGQIERVKEFLATDPWVTTTKQAEISAATSTTVTNPPTIGYHVKNAVLFDGSIYVRNYKYPIAQTALFNSASHKTRHIRTAGLASTYLGAKYFGHWLRDDSTKYLLAEEFGPPLCVRRPPYGHQQKYQTYFAQDWTPIDRAYIDHLVVFQDFAQNSFKRNRYRLLRTRLKAHFPGDGRSSFIYLKRGKTGLLRTIQNETEIIDALTRRSFAIVDVESDNVDHIIDALGSAKIVVSIEGSHIAHCTYRSPENSGLLVLQPSDRFSAAHRAWSECLGIRFGFVVGYTTGDGYYFPVDDILRTIDLLLTKIEGKNGG